jgi:hypothetical protein
LRPEELNRLIPELESILGRIEDLRQEIARRAEAIERLGYNPATSRMRDLPPDVAELRHGFDATIAELEAEIGRIGALGGVLEDMERGFVDFHHDLDGCDVLLCWQIGEHEVTHFHAVDAGFSLRRPLPGTFLPN